jgi:hypothetical protein
MKKKGRSILAKPFWSSVERRACWVVIREASYMYFE